VADLVSLLRDVRGVFSDAARDRIPPGSMWEMTDWVPLVLQAGARMRGAWKYQSPTLQYPPDGMLFAPYINGSHLLVANGNALTDISLTSVAKAEVPASIPTTVQNPVFHRDRVIVPAGDGISLARYIQWDGVNWTVTNGPSGSPQAVGRYAIVWKDRVVFAASAPNPQQIVFSKIGDPTATFDPYSYWNTSLPLNGIAPQRTQILCFHDSSVERLRGTVPPDSTLPDPTGDLVLDILFDRAGCYDARSIAAYQDNTLFADGRGIWLTDGALVRNVTVQGGAVNLWYKAFARPGPPDSIAAVVYRDYYICTLRHSSQPPITFVIDIPTRRLFTLGNIDARCFAFSVGTVEKLFGADQKSSKVTDLTPLFNPDPTALQIDGDGAPVLPVISTGWATLDGKVGYKRVVEAHVSYLATRDDDQEIWQMSYVSTPTGTDKALLQLKPTKGYTRRPVMVRRRVEGVAMKIVQTLPTKDSRLFDISLRTYPEEQSKT